MISPPVAPSRRRRARPVVVLPQPDSPTRARISPFLIWKLMWSTAFTNFFSVETMLLKKPSVIGK